MSERLFAARARRREGRRPKSGGGEEGRSIDNPRRPAQHSDRRTGGHQREDRRSRCQSVEC